MRPKSLYLYFKNQTVYVVFLNRCATAGYYVALESNDTKFTAYGTVSYQMYYSTKGDCSFVYVTVCDIFHVDDFDLNMIKK